MSPSAQQTRSPSAPRWRGSRTVAAGVVGMTVLVPALLLGAGAASAAPTLTCPAGQKPVLGTVGLVCRAVAGTAGGVVSAVPKATAPVRSVVPKVVTPPKSVVPKVVGGATGAVVPAPGSAGTGSGSSSSGRTTKAPGSASAAPASSAPVTAAAPAPAVVGVAAATSPLSADTSVVTAFGAAPAGLLAATGLSPSTGTFGALMSAAPGGRGYDPGLLLSSVTPVRQFLPSPVTTSSTAQPLALLGAGSRVGTPLLLTVLTATVLLALGVRGWVLRRARTRAGL